MMRIFLSLLSVLPLLLSFPNFDIGFLAWIALVSLLLAFKNGSLKSVLILSWVSGTTPSLFVAVEYLCAAARFVVYFSSYSDGPTFNDWLGDSFEHSSGRELSGFSHFEIVGMRG